jgi:hypothetical protein
LAAVLGAVCIALLVPACAQGAATQRTVSLLPATAASGHAWVWTPTCQFGPSRTGTCAPSAPNVGPAQLDGDEWNLGGSGGSVAMSVDSAGGLAVRGDLPSAPPCTSPSCIAPSANTWVRGFPSVSYGLTQCAATSSPPQSPQLRLPMQVGAIPADLIATTSYDSAMPDVTYDIAYDLWLSASSTTTPCHTDGALEVMLWTDYTTSALLPQGMQVGVASIPFTVNGTAHAGNGAWSVYAGNVYRGGHTAPWGGTVWLVLDQADVVASGTVSVDLSAALGAVGTVLQHTFGWDDFGSSYWLDTIPFGAEFGPGNGATYGTGPAHFSLRLYSYCLSPAARVTDTGCRAG